MELTYWYLFPTAIIIATVANGAGIGGATFFSPLFVIALGLDTAKGDPTGTWTLSSKDFYNNGNLIGKFKIPTLVVQEGGYRNRVLGINARHFFQGFHDAINNKQT